MEHNAKQMSFVNDNYVNIIKRLDDIDANIISLSESITDIDGKIKKIDQRVTSLENLTGAKVSVSSSTRVHDPSQTHVPSVNGHLNNPPGDIIALGKSLYI